jgi:hypothetical protein
MNDLVRETEVVDGGTTGTVEFDDGNAFHRSINAADVLVNGRETIRTEVFPNLAKDYLVRVRIPFMQCGQGVGFDVAFVGIHHGYSGIQQTVMPE